MSKHVNADTRPTAIDLGTLTDMNPPAMMEKHPTTSEQLGANQDKWFESPEAQARHQKALDDVANGRVERFESGDDLLRRLKSA